jgi:hypothetical protein
MAVEASFSRVPRLRKSEYAGEQVSFNITLIIDVFSLQLNVQPPPSLPEAQSPEGTWKKYRSIS